MSDIKNIDNILSDNTDITVKKKNRIVSIIILVASVVFGYFSMQMPDNENLGFALLFVGIVLAVIGLVGTLKPKKYLCYIPTGEVLKEHLYYFDAGDKKAVDIAIKAGELNLLKLMTTKESTNMRAIVYTTPSMSYVVSQMQTYVPYEYVPVEEAFICNISPAR